MFKVNSNTDRLNYGDILMPPPDYSLDAAIGTTYSLDLEALTSIAISLGLSEETDSELMHNPICMLNALQRVSDRILIFCEAGQIKLPANPSSLCIILEKMVVPVALPFDKSFGRYPAFHPKTWILVYKNSTGDKLYRFVVLSRNLTFDRSWDVSVALDGISGRTENKDSRPIVDFLEFLRTQVKTNFEGAGEKRALINSVIKEVTTAVFKTEDSRFSDFKIMPLGIGDKEYKIEKDPLWTDTFHEMLIMSPFLSGSIIEHFNDSKKGLKDCKRTLITRRTELEKISGGKADRFDVYVMKDTVFDGEDELSDETGDKQKQDIHAKLYLRRKDSNVDLYLGSMNASYAAMNKNVEMMIRLQTKNRYLNTDVFLRDIFGGDADGKENPFEKADLNVELQPEEENELNKMEKEIKDLCRSGGKAVVMEDDGRYRIKLTFSIKEPLGNVSISPLYSKKSEPLKQEIIFENLDMLQVSEFYKVVVTGKEQSLERVIMIPTENLPKDRDAEVVQSVVKDKKSFMEYVLFVLNDDHLLAMLENMDTQSGTGNKGYQQSFPAVYEAMLKAAAEDKEKLKDIDRLLDLIKNKDIVPDYFRDMYNTFKQALNLK